jgi:hypothetical protein
MALQYKSLGLMFYVSHDRYQYGNPIRSKHTGACPREHSQQLLWGVAVGRLHLQNICNIVPEILTHVLNNVKSLAISNFGLYKTLKVLASFIAAECSGRRLLNITRNNKIA